MKRTAVFSTAFVLAMGLPFAAQAQTTITIAMAGEAYDGAPEFEILVGDDVVAAGRLSNAVDTEGDARFYLSPEPLGYLEHFEFVIDDDQLDPRAEISIVLINDIFIDEGLGRDRNLFVQSIAVNGTERLGSDLKAVLDGQVIDLAFQAGLLPVYQQGQAVVAEPPATGWPSSDVAELTLGALPLPARFNTTTSLE
jgi:hypothetical protein